MINGGRNATRNGKQLELATEAIIRGCGYIKSENGRGLFTNRETIDGMYYAPQVYVGENFYGDHRIVDFFLVNKLIFPQGKILECKWQQVPGSADEKLKALYEDIMKTKIQTIVIIGGNGFRPKIIKYLRDRIDRHTLEAIWTTEEFQIQVNNGFLGTGIIKQIKLPRNVKKPAYHKDIWGESIHA